MHNALEQPAIERNPQVARLRELFARGPFLGTAMSGSGSSYFGLCHGRGQARAIAGRLRAMRLGQVFVAQTSP
jgi:4-diphosphocytidyl-2C-methyl-D-erythritol kinase